jgi:hypothetical protein
MIPSGHHLAWIRPRGVDEFVGVFVGEGATHDAHRHSPGLAPATQFCSSFDEARQWVENQAAALDLQIK